MSLAVVCEVMATRIMVSGTLKDLLQKENTLNDDLNLRSIVKLYFPLALTSILSLGVHLLVSFFMDRSYTVLKSLANSWFIDVSRMRPGLADIA